MTHLHNDTRNTPDESSPPGASPTPTTEKTEGNDGSESRKRAWSLTLILVALYTLNNGDKIVLGIVAEPLREEYGFSASQIGLAASAFFVAMTGAGFATGLIKRYVTLRWSLSILALAWALCMLPLVVAGSFAVLLAARFFLGLFEGPSSALIHTATYSWHPLNKRALPGAFITSAAAIAKILLAPALGFVTVTMGWRAAFIALACASVLWMSVWLVTWSPGPYGDEYKRTKGRTFRTPSQTKDAAEPASASTTKWRDVLLTPTFIAGAVAVFSFYTLTAVVMTWLPSYFENALGFTRLQASTLFAVPSIVALVALFSSTSVADRLMTRGVSSRIHRGIVPAVALLVCGVCMSAVPSLGDRTAVVVVVALGYGVGTVVFPLFNAAISEISPPDKLAGSLGLFLACMTTGGLIGPFVSGWIVDHADTVVDGYNLVFRLIGVLTLIGAASALVFVDAQRDSARIAAITARRAEALS